MGDLILISADISESLGKILPLEQSLIPVSFKRKLAYQGSYIEEFVEKDKVKTYFEWFKLNNHLYSDFLFDEVLLDDFESALQNLKLIQNRKKTSQNRAVMMNQ